MLLLLFLLLLIIRIRFRFRRACTGGGTTRFCGVFGAVARRVARSGSAATCSVIRVTALLFGILVRSAGVGVAVLESVEVRIPSVSERNKTQRLCILSQKMCNSMWNKLLQAALETYPEAPVVKVEPPRFAPG